jgi:beta-mannosidase
MKRLNLNGDWSVEKAGEKTIYPARVPGDIHGDLFRSKVIPDPYYRDNELDLFWIGEADWIYSRDFTVTKAVLKHDRVLLRCEGLDTLATIKLNGRTIAKTDNMHRTWEFDIKETLREGRNTITIRFDSATRFVREKDRQRKLPQWIQPGSVPGGNHLRKEPCNFGWDWGPSLVTCGIWRDIHLLAFNTARLTDVLITQKHTKSEARLQIHLTAGKTNKERLSGRITFVHNGTRIVKEADFKGQKAEIDLTVKNPDLWWPNGMGPQHLHDLTAELLDSRGRVIDKVSKRIGLRTLKLDRHKDKWGESFQFVANGVPFFAKGANWIPAEAILSRLTRKDYERLIKDSAAANMNMLRVWGGGIYEDDAFYELCDEYGICVWQDFIFSCAAYPTDDPQFMENVAAEAEDNIRRIRHHPSLALWCGNNELEMGLVADEWTDITMSWADYTKLFDELLPEIVNRLDPDRDYWPSSPHSPVGPRINHSSPESGDAHLWAVWHGRRPFEWYRTCEHRFNSEFGFQSFPEPKTIHSFTRPEDRNVTSFIMEHHQRSRIGNTTIMRYMLDWFRLPGDFEMTLWLSQILQGMAIKYACEHWRRSMPRGMGTLYWQLNDCWPVASWASIDSLGRWKALHYMARNFFAPVLVSGLEDKKKGTVEIHVTNDGAQAADVEIKWTLTTATGKSIISDKMIAKVPSRKNKRITTVKLKQYLDEYGPRNLMLWLELVEKRKIVSNNFVTFARPKHLELENPKLALKVIDDKDQPEGSDFLVVLKARKPALWTWLELKTGGAKFSDNFFHVRPGRPVKVRVKTNRKMTAERAREMLVARSLYDTFETH